MDDPGPTSSFLRTFPQTRDGPVRPSSPPLEPLLTDVQEDESSDESLYTILNLARDASEAEIRDRYRSLATTFHPDRQRDDRSRLAAHGRFTSIQRAYEILTDSTKRTIYDLFGEEGLKTSWELGPRIRTKEEMRAEFQRQAGEKRRIDAEALIKPKGDINLVLDARAVFVPRTAFKDPDAISHTPWARVQRVRPGQIVMKHSFETPVGDKTQLQVTGQMASRNGAGGGNVVGTVRHQFSPKFWVEGGAGLLNPRVLTGKATYTVDENTYVRDIIECNADVQICNSQFHLPDILGTTDHISHPRPSHICQHNRSHYLQIRFLVYRLMGKIPSSPISPCRSLGIISRSHNDNEEWKRMDIRNSSWCHCQPHFCRLVHESDWWIEGQGWSRCRD